uniref:Protein SDE2 homolog n=1 Tax=Schistocephalus solidus TaxID=70667 RepID=A0A0X3NPX6_SCHSO
MLVPKEEFFAADDKNEDSFYTLSGRILLPGDSVPPDVSYVEKHFRLRGGKGGFGSMLRAIGNQIEKTTNREMCRDLSGRRMRDVNAEEKLKQWYAKASEREREKVDRYLERQKRRRETLEKGPLYDHKFDDPEYYRRKAKISDELQSAVNDALEKVVANAKASTTSEPGPSSAPKRQRLWIEHLDGDSLSSDDTDDSSSSAEASPKSDSVVVTSSSETANEETSKTAWEVSDASPVIKDENTGDIPALKPEESAASSAANPIPTSKLEPVPSKPVVPGLTEDELSATNSASELEARGLDCLKQSLIDRGLKCGGSLKERAVRLFSVRNLAPADYPAKLKVKPPK